MRDSVFPQPVSVYAGLGHVRTVATVSEAMSCLQGIEGGVRDEALEAVMAACRDALSERCSAEEARDVFVAYGRRRGILAEDASVNAAPGPMPAGLLAV